MGRYGVEVFLKKISELRPEEFIGICKIMNIDLVDVVEKKTRPAEELIHECTNKFKAYSRERRKNLINLLAAATKKEK